MKNLLKYLILFLIGGGTYYLIEILSRGYSHWSMAVLGGVCFIAVGLLNEIFPWSMPFGFQCLIGGGVITTLELITGIITNIILKWHIWDYSGMPLNFMGQICLPFTLLWVLLSALIILLDDFIRYKFFGEEKPKYKFLIMG